MYQPATGCWRPTAKCVGNNSFVWGKRAMHASRPQRYWERELPRTKSTHTFKIDCSQWKKIRIGLLWSKSLNNSLNCGEWNKICSLFQSNVEKFSNKWTLIVWSCDQFIRYMCAGKLVLTWSLKLQTLWEHEIILQPLWIIIGLRPLCKRSSQNSLNFQ